jgi:hypothetical protein
MVVASAFGFELTKFIGDEGVDFLLAEAEVEGLDHELFECGPDLVLSFDANQRKLAKAAGLKIRPI